MDRPAAPQRRGLRMRGVRRLAVVVLGLSLAVVAGCAAPPPTMDEVLDGQATAQVRNAAIAQVEQWPQGLSVPGLTEVARQVYTTCKEGHNGWWTNDGYRLKCEAHSLIYFGWNGNFARGRDAAVAGVRRICSGSELQPYPRTPGDVIGQTGPIYSCPPATTVYSQLTTGHAPKVVVTLDSWLDTYGGLRRVSGPKDDMLRQMLTKSTWLMVTDVRVVFFQDGAK